MKSDQQERILAIIILILSFFVPLPFLGIVSGLFFLRQISQRRLSERFKWGAYLLFFEQILIYIPMIVYLVIHR